MFVMYNSTEEILITTKENEQKLVAEWFNPQTGRDIDDYNRTEPKDYVVRIQSKLSAY